MQVVVHSPFSSGWGPQLVEERGESMVMVGKMVVPLLSSSLWSFSYVLLCPTLSASSVRDDISIWPPSARSSQSQTDTFGEKGVLWWWPSWSWSSSP